MDKRTFISRMGKAALLSPFLPFGWEALASVGEVPKRNVAGADFWAQIRADYELKPEYINLENGYYNIAPRPVLQRFIQHVTSVNREGSYYMRTEQFSNKARIAARLAKLLNTSAEELIITRNTTESLDMIISGFPWKEGDEAVFANQDYGSMIDQFKLISRRHGVVNKVIDVPMHPEDDEEIISRYEKQIGPKTRLLMVCHMINITGQILPVRKICDMAHSHGVEVLVDGAHCVGHIEVDIGALNCDYYGSSLHKWLSTPLGAGILYVRREKIPKIWPLLAEADREEFDISRLNHTGTHPVHTDLAIEDAIDYLEMIGLPRKEERLRYLQRYWSDQLRDFPGVDINTPEDPARSCGIANVGIRGLPPKQFAAELLEEFGVFTVAIDFAGVKGCRITPNVYTTTEELDRFVAAVKTIAARN